MKKSAPWIHLVCMSFFVGVTASGGEQVSTHPDFKSFRRNVEKCLKERDVNCLLGLSAVEDMSSFSNLMPDLGADTIQCSSNPEKVNFSAKEVYECLFRPGGKNLLKHTLAALDAKDDSFRPKERTNRKGQKIKFFALYSTEAFVVLRIEKVDGVWKISGLNTN